MSTHEEHDWDIVLHERYSWSMNLPRNRRSYQHRMRVKLWLAPLIMLLLFFMRTVLDNYCWNDISNLPFYVLRGYGAQLGTINLSSFQMGARVIPELTDWAPPNTKRTKWSIFAERRKVWPPAVALQGKNAFTRCWCSKGHSSDLGIQLIGSGYVYTVTVEHNLQALVEDNQSAPRDIRIWGILESNLHHPENRSKLNHSGMEMLLLASFTFDATSIEPEQNFTMPLEARRHLISRVVFDIVNNWGGGETCIYGVRVYGYESSSEAV